MTTPFIMLSIRFFLTFLILLGIKVIQKRKLSIQKKALRGVLLLGLVQPILYFIFEAYGVKILPTSYVGIILSIIPIISFLLGFLLLAERVSALQILFAILSIFGVFLTTTQFEGSFSWLGFFLILGSVVSAAFFNVLSRKLTTHVSAFDRTFVMFGMGFVFFSMMALIEGLTSSTPIDFAFLGNISFWLAMLYLAGVSSVIAFLLINSAMNHATVAQASIFANLTTVIAIFSGVVFLHENIGWVEILGTIIIIGSVLAVTQLKRQTRSIQKK